MGDQRFDHRLAVGRPVMADLASTAKKIERLEAQLAALKEERDRLIAEALAEGATVRKVATISGVSKSRVDQIHRGVPR